MSQLTNIGATNVARVPRDATPKAGTPVGIRPGDGPVALVIQPAPLFVSRWQQSATVPFSKAPWVTGYRIWRGRAAYEDEKGLRVGPPPGEDWIDCIFKDGFKCRYRVPEPTNLATMFVALMGRNQSIGQWIHANLLQNGRNKYPTVPL